MTIRIGFLRFVRGLSVDRSERRRLAKASTLLLRQRRRSLNLLSPWLRALPPCGSAKLQLWQGLARTCRKDFFFQDSPALYAAAIRSTHAYADAEALLQRDRNGFLQRGFNYSRLRLCWNECPPRRLLIFHHFDRRGILPCTWRDALLAAQAAGWQVVFSTSYVNPAVIAALEQKGIQIASRVNIGLCIGAYRDLALLLHYTPAVYRHLQSLVFVNDSTLLVQSPEVFLSQLERWTTESDADFINPGSTPVLAGLTDSFERQTYHLQSFLLHVNRALLIHPAWLRFWLNFTMVGSKDDLINHGEIGLSQALLMSDVVLKPVYPLVEGLLTDPSMAEELQTYGISQPQQVNQSLFSWRSLLSRGFPLVKKHVLFQLADHHGQKMTIAELSRWIPQERFELLSGDIQQLLISRYSGRQSHIA